MDGGKGEGRTTVTSIIVVQLNNGVNIKEN